jgi:hypothetical protein
METFRNHETQWSDGICKRLQAGYTKSNDLRTKIISGFWIYLAVFVTAIYISSCTADIGELEKEVKKTMVNTMREKGQSLTITKLSLVHQGGNNYEGLAAGTLDGEKIELDVYVVYDGASFKAEWQPTAEYVQKENNRIYEEQQREYDRMMKENQKQQEKALREVEEAERELEMQMNTNDWN